jgi:hypothetical protein
MRGGPVIHVVFDRRFQRLAVFGPDGHLWHKIAAGGDAHGAARFGPAAGAALPEGHYLLVGQVVHDPATVDDGPGAIDVGNLDDGTLQRLVDAGRARRLRGETVEIARLAGRVGRLVHEGRGGFAIRGGGRALARLTPPEDPLAPYQRLTRTDGVRVHNADLARLMMILAPAFATTTIVLTVLGET